MREKLKNLVFLRTKFKAEFVKIKTVIRKGFNLDALLFINVESMSGIILTDHIWMNNNKSFEKINLKEGDIISFYARVKPYMKGYLGEDKEIDYKLVNPTKMKILKRKEILQNVLYITHD